MAGMGKGKKGKRRGALPGLPPGGGFPDLAELTGGTAASRSPDTVHDAAGEGAGAPACANRAFASERRDRPCRYALPMRTVFVGEHPELDAIITRRRASGADTHDEVWDGEYHMAPAPHTRHARLEAELIAAARERRPGHAASPYRVR